MLMNGYMLMTLVNERQRELIAESERRHVLAAARDARKGRHAGKVAAVRGRPTGNLATCEPSAVVPAR